MACNINKSDPGTTLPKQRIVKEGGEGKKKQQRLFKSFLRYT